MNIDNWTTITIQIADIRRFQKIITWTDQQVGTYTKDWLWDWFLTEDFSYKFYFAKPEHATLFALRWV